MTYPKKMREILPKTWSKLNYVKRYLLSNFMSDIVVCLKNSDVRMLAHVKNYKGKSNIAISN